VNPEDDPERASIGVPPSSLDEAIGRLRAARVPTEIVGVASRLQAHGHAAVLVGGAVRDALLTLPADDWDLATSATPAEVQALFPRTLPTGLEHGTVTVMVHAPRSGPRRKPVPVEVTTFRGEGAYLDGRRPSTVVFHRELRDDLARRDFTINAFAWDPVARVFSDPFDGLADLQARVLRAVGDPLERFQEDGLRTLRAVRFCATRAVTLEANTAAAIPERLTVLDSVSRERVWVELGKLLSAPVPSRGLVPMVETGVWPHVLPDFDPRDAFPSVDALPPDPVLRLARLLLSCPPGVALERFGALKPSRVDKQRLGALLSSRGADLARAEDPVAARRAAAVLGREHVADLLALHAVPEERASMILGAIDGSPLSVRELAISGRDLQSAGIARPGPAMGQLLDALLEAVIEQPELNFAPHLLTRARDMTGRE